MLLTAPLRSALRNSKSALHQQRAYATKMATPVILMGLSWQMGGKVGPKLQPEYEAVQFITSVERAKEEIPLLLAGKEPPKDPDNVGTHNFSHPPQAVLFGRGFGPQQVQMIREACGGSSAGLIWVNSVEKSRANVASKPPDLSKPDEVEVYSDQVVASLKEVLASVKAQGKWGVDGMYEYE